ncbi:MAG: phosphoribosylformylglycinamidine synthase, partial [Cyclobacteriaceae bacterium]|nr:phosphoribosylformylglycinamidine synthase [Cyclobacteriaceae bacterium]
NLEKLNWLFGDPEKTYEVLSGKYIGPRKEMITPWSTNAVEITQNMGITGIVRVEELWPAKGPNPHYDPMMQTIYENAGQDIFTIQHAPEEIIDIVDIATYNKAEGLALSSEEIEYLENVSKDLGRPLTDSEVFGFSQVNSEHCRHKIFNGTFIINEKEKEETLFQLIKKTAKKHPNLIVSAYKDNVAFIDGPVIDQFAPDRQDIAGIFQTTPINSIISLKAETHNFPTTVEPFNGAATGSGGEIRDRLAGGRGSLPLAGTAVYMTSYTRLEKDRTWEKNHKERKWLYQTPVDILIKASDGASDFGNKFGQPLIAGSLFTFEHIGGERDFGFDKVIMMAGGVGYAKKEESQKGTVTKGDKVVILGGDNYRIGMGGGAVSSVATGEFKNSIELNAVQRSNPEMQKRAMNVIRALQESKENPIISIHDHGAGGHLNCLSELLEETGGVIDVSKLPVGDPTLSEKEIIGNESQERMGLVFHEKDINLVKTIAERERSPFYEVGVATGDMKFSFKGKKGKDPINWSLTHMFGSSPKTILEDSTFNHQFPELPLTKKDFTQVLEDVLQLEAVACKDWLTNKVDRSVSGRVATQQTCGELQLPLNNVGVMALDFTSNKGIATSIGHSPVSALINAGAGSRLSIAEALTNLVFAPLTHGLKGVSLSANWMWPAKVNGENGRLYEAVEAVSQFAIELGINIPTGKDSLSMTQKYPDGQLVYSPGTVIISSVGEVSDIRKTVNPDLKNVENTHIYFIDFSSTSPELGGSALSQVLGTPGRTTPDIQDASYFAKAFHTLQDLVNKGKILAGHDIGSGGLITTLLEMCFPTTQMGMDVAVELNNDDLFKFMFAENPGIVIQAGQDVEEAFQKAGIRFNKLGSTNTNSTFTIGNTEGKKEYKIAQLRDVWFKTSSLLDKKQRPAEIAESRYRNYKNQPLRYTFTPGYEGSYRSLGITAKREGKSGITAAIIREKGINGDREMAYALHIAGFDVKDIHMTD